MLLLSLTGIALCAPLPSEAQFFGGGGDLPVIDNTNLIQNVLTALRMLHQIGNSDQEVAMMLQNLLTGQGQAAYDLVTLEQLLWALSQSAGVRPNSGRTLDYFQQDLSSQMATLFPGTTPTNDYLDLNALNMDTTLNTLQSVIAQTGPAAGLDGDVRYHATRDALYGSSDAAQGNLQVLQAGNAINLSTADAVHRVEKALAGLTNVMAATQAQQLQKEAWGEAALSQGLHLAGADDDTPPYDTSSGFGEIPSGDEVILQ